MLPPWQAITPWSLGEDAISIAAVMRNEQFLRLITELSGMRTWARV